MNRPDVLVLTPDADAYLRELRELAAGGTRVVAAPAAEAVDARHEVFPVVLGQPDCVADYLAAGARVRWVQSTWAGVGPLLATARKDYVLTAVKDVFGAQIADYVMAYVLAHEIKLLERLGRQARRNWWPEDSGSPADKTMAILGTGSIGSHLARVAAAFGTRVIGLSRSGQPVDAFDAVYTAPRLAEFLAGADYVVSTLPDTAQTRGLLDRRAFGAMKKAAYFINVGRGTVLDEEALLEALESGHLAGAALDVFREEPLPPEHPLWHAQNCIVTAHIAARSRPADIVAIFLENYERFVRGETLNYRVDIERGY